MCVSEYSIGHGVCKAGRKGSTVFVPLSSGTHMLSSGLFFLLGGAQGIMAYFDQVRANPRAPHSVLFPCEEGRMEWVPGKEPTGAGGSGGREPAGIRSGFEEGNQQSMQRL